MHIIWHYGPNSTVVELCCQNYMLLLRNEWTLHVKKKKKRSFFYIFFKHCLLLILIWALNIDEAMLKIVLIKSVFNLQKKISNDSTKEWIISFHKQSNIYKNIAIRLKLSKNTVAKNVQNYKKNGELVYRWNQIGYESWHQSLFVSSGDWLKTWENWL